MLDMLLIEKYSGPNLDDNPTISFSYSYKVELKIKEYLGFSILKLEFNMFGLTNVLFPTVNRLIIVVLK